jgi:hypothetical protein
MVFLHKLMAMYHSWETLFIKTEQELKDPARIQRVLRARGAINGWVIFGFIFGGLVSAGLGAFMIWVFGFEQFELKGILGSIPLLLMTAACFYTAKLFSKEITLDLIRKFLKNPEDFEFIKGQLCAAFYLAGEKRSQDSMVIEGRGTTSSGVEVKSRDQMHPSIWPFTSEEADTQLKPGDDYFDQKGRRPRLPVPIYLLCPKENPKWAVFVGIDRELMTKILKK